MLSMGGYPAGAQYDKRAPYNQKDNDERTFNVDVEYVMRKEDIEVQTDDYFYEDDYEDFSVNTSLTDFEVAYTEQHYTIPEMLVELKKYVEREMQFVEMCSGRARELKRLLADCQGWKIVEAQVEES